MGQPALLRPLGLDPNLNAYPDPDATTEANEFGTRRALAIDFRAKAELREKIVRELRIGP